MADEAPRPDVAGRAVVAIGVFFAVQLLVASVAARTGIVTGPAGTVRLLVATAIAHVVFLAFAAAVPPLLPWGNLPRLLPRVVWRYLLFLLPWGLAFMVLYPLLLQGLGVDFGPQRLMEYVTGHDASVGGVILLLVVAGVLAPLVEELVFRGYLQQAIERVCGTWPAIVLAAAAFGLMHVQQDANGDLDWNFVAPIGVLGIFFGWLRVRFRALWASMIAHSLHNTWNITASLLIPQLTDMIYHR